MNINEVSKTTGLTKKAINYYISKGLINPTRNLENNYRVFEGNDINNLNLISILRQLNISVNEIRKLFDGKTTYKELMEKRLKEIENNIFELKEEKNLIENHIYKLDNKSNSNFEELNKFREELKYHQTKRKNYVNTQWQNIFPGSLGRLLSLVYGSFLVEALDTKEKKEAWESFVSEIDKLEEIVIPMEIKEIINSKEFIEYVNNSENSNERIEKFGIEIIESIENVNKLEITEYQKKQIKNLMRVQKFLRENLNDKLPELDNYLEIISNKYRKYKKDMENTVKLIKNKYKNLYETFDKLKKEISS